MNNSKPETNVISDAKPEVGNPTVKDASGAPVNQPEPMSEGAKNALKEGKPSATTPSSTR
jgi:hypothetical protein